MAVIIFQFLGPRYNKLVHMHSLPSEINLVGLKYASKDEPPDSIKAYRSFTIRSIYSTQYSISVWTFRKSLTIQCMQDENYTFGKHDFTEDFKSTRTVSFNETPIDRTKKTRSIGTTNHLGMCAAGARERFFLGGGGGAKMLICLVIAKI